MALGAGRGRGVAVVCAAVVARTLPASLHFDPAPPAGAAFVTMARAALADRALLSLYALGSCAVGALVAAFNALGFRLTQRRSTSRIGAVSLVFLVYPLGTVSSTVSGGSPTGSGGGRSCRPAARSRWSASSSPCRRGSRASSPGSPRSPSGSSSSTASRAAGSRPEPTPPGSAPARRRRSTCSPTTSDPRCSASSAATPGASPAGRGWSPSPARCCSPVAGSR